MGEWIQNMWAAISVFRDLFHGPAEALAELAPSNAPMWHFLAWLFECLFWLWYVSLMIAGLRAQRAWFRRRGMPALDPLKPFRDRFGKLWVHAVDQYARPTAELIPYPPADVLEAAAAASLTDPFAPFEGPGGKLWVHARNKDGTPAEEVIPYEPKQRRKPTITNTRATAKAS